jgi:sugar-specific transcriptional regulator TrmB
MDNQLLKQLVNFGLSEKEAKVYLALLELEMATVFEVAKQSGINRSSAYVVLETLKKKGFVGISDDKKIRNYIAASPETLLHSAKAAAKKQEETKSGIETILPELKALHKGTKRRPIVKIFEGENAAREVYLSLFSTKTNEIRTYANPTNIFKRVPDFIEAGEGLKCI